MKARFAYPLILLAALLGYLVGQGGDEQGSDVDQKARADHFQKRYWQALGRAADAEENPEKWIITTSKSGNADPAKSP